MFQSIPHCYLVMVVLLNSLQQEKSGIGWNSSRAFLSYCSIPISRSGHVEWRWSLASSLDLTPSARGLGEVQEDVWTAWASSRGGDPASVGSLHNYITQLHKAESPFLPVQCISLVLRNGQSCLLPVQGMEVSESVWTAFSVGGKACPRCEQGRVPLWEEESKLLKPIRVRQVLNMSHISQLSNAFKPMLSLSKLMTHSPMCTAE